MERLQDGYLAIIRNKSLQKYDPHGGCSFETYICNVMMWGSVRRQARRKNEQRFTNTDMDTMADSTTERELRERIQDYRSWLAKNGGQHLGVILQDLQERVMGKVSSDAAAQEQYRQHLKRFLTAEL